LKKGGRQKRRKKGKSNLGGESGWQHAREKLEGDRQEQLHEGNDDEDGEGDQPEQIRHGPHQLPANNHGQVIGNPVGLMVGLTSLPLSCMKNGKEGCNFKYLLY
jgi:hypothetical protein